MLPLSTFILPKPKPSQTKGTRISSVNVTYTIAAVCLTVAKKDGVVPLLPLPISTMTQNKPSQTKGTLMSNANVIYLRLSLLINQWTTRMTMMCHP